MYKDLNARSDLASVCGYNYQFPCRIFRRITTIFDITCFYQLPSVVLLEYCSFIFPMYNLDLLEV